MIKKLYVSLIFSNLVVFKTLVRTIVCTTFLKFVKMHFEICKQFSENLVNESGNDVVVLFKFSDLEVVFHL